MKEFNLTVPDHVTSVVINIVQSNSKPLYKEGDLVWATNPRGGSRNLGRIGNIEGGYYAWIDAWVNPVAGVSLQAEKGWDRILLSDIAGFASEGEVKAFHDISSREDYCSGNTVVIRSVDDVYNAYTEISWDSKQNKFACAPCWYPELDRIDEGGTPYLRIVRKATPLERSRYREAVRQRDEPCTESLEAGMVVWLRDFSNPQVPEVHLGSVRLRRRETVAPHELALLVDGPEGLGYQTVVDLHTERVIQLASDEFNYLEDIDIVSRVATPAEAKLFHSLMRKAHEQVI
jgi:hypothetical protein